MKNTRARKAAKTPFALRLLRFIYNTAGRIFPVYFGNKAYELWFATTRLKTPVYEQPALTSSHQETIQVNNLPITVYRWWQKNSTPQKTVLFIHGWTGRGTQIVKGTSINCLCPLRTVIHPANKPAHWK